MSGSQALDPLLVWRARGSSGAPSGLVTVQSVRDAGDVDFCGPCDYCAEPVVGFQYSSEEETLHYEEWKDFRACGFCGWGVAEWSFEDLDGSADLSGDFRWTSQNVLGPVDLANPDVNVHELTTAIAANPQRAGEMSPRNFERLVGDVFRAGGYSVELTSPTRDAGRDLILMRQSDEVATIVEVKRYRGRVGVELVRQLRGVQLRDNVPHAILVASNGFTAGAHAEAAALTPRVYGFSMELMALADLVRAMGVLEEPLASPSASARARAEYRSWLIAEFGSCPAYVPPRFPRLEHHPWARRW